MSDAARENSQGFELLNLYELLLHPFSLGDVLHRSSYLQHAATLILDRTKGAVVIRRSARRQLHVVVHRQGLSGFDGPTRNAYASIASVDYFTEFLGAASALLINTGKFAQEFLLMAMMEFDVIRLPDGYVQSSSIMPQKRNPVAIEHVRAIASKALGQALGVLTSVHNTPFGDINDVEDDLQPLNFSATRDATRAVSLLGHALEAAEFNLDLLRERAEANFITVTELADTIVRADGLAFSAAHGIAARAVAAAIDDDGVITHGILQDAAEAVIGRPLSLSAEDVDKAMSAEHFVNVRNIHGGPAPEETREALKEQREAEAASAAWRSTAGERLEAAADRLEKAVGAFCG